MHRLHFRLSGVLLLVTALISVAGTCLAQSSRGSITGKVVDPQSAAVPAAAVTVTNAATNVVSRTTTNNTGYFEVNFLDSGNYVITVEMQGFKKLVRSGIVLDTGDRLALDLALDIGQATQSVEVTADAPLLESTNAAGGKVLDTRDIAQLPYNTMNPFTLQAVAPGMFFTGTLGNNRVMDHAGTASYDEGGLASGTGEFLLDGAPVTGTNGGRAGFVPSSEAVDEMRVETSPFDASLGHSVGVYISATTKSGTNTVHGSGYWQMQQTRWNATPHFARLTYQAGLANGTIAPGTPEQNSGKFSQPGFSLGGPVWIPKLIHGKNKLFFFINYSKLTQKSPPINNTPVYTVPTAAERLGDFSALLTIPNSSQYIVYDPRSAATVSGQVTRTPFPGNKLPASMMADPIYKFFQQLYPAANNPASLMGADGSNNFYDSGQANNDFCPSLVNKYDYVITAKQRLSGKWYYNVRRSDQYDWTHGTPLGGMYSNGLWRPTRGAGLDWLYTLNATNVLSVTASFTQFGDGSDLPIKLSYKASQTGLPAYIDQKAASYNDVPAVFINGYANAASSTSYPGLNQWGTTEQLAPKLTSVHGRHTLKMGYEERRYHYATINPGGNPTGIYTFDKTYLQQAANTSSNAVSSVGLGWASFLMGMPTGIALDTNDTGYFSTRYHGAYVQDDLRLTSRLRVGFGLRWEREGGTTERFNRGLTGMYDFGYTPPYASGVQTAYASMLADPANANNAAIQLLNQNMPASQFKVAGGVTYLGTQYPNLTAGTNRFLPNGSMVYSFNNKTVLRVGAGLYGDTFSAMSSTTSRSNQIGYNQATRTTITNDNGLTYCCSVGAASNLGNANLMQDPFPVGSSGSRWVMPFGNSLGSNVLAGQGYTYLPRDYKPTWDGRWKISIQREIHGNHMIDVSYNGSYASSPMNQNLSDLPARFWNFSNSKNTAVDSAMTATVANPFNTGYASLQSSNPTLYNYLSSIGMFSGKTLTVQQLLRAYPNAGFGLTKADSVRSKTVYNDVQIMYQKRWSKGFQSSVMYTRNWARQQWLPNQFDQTPAWQPNSSSRPMRLVWSAVWELPFGKGRQWVTSGPMQHVVGGWQLSWIYQYQSGALISFGNLFSYGTVDQLVKALNIDSAHASNIHTWFDPAAVWTGSTAPPSGFVGFEGRSTAQPGTYQARVFPQYIDGVRADPIRNWDVKVYRKFKLYERLNMNVSVDLLNLTNHTQFGAPNLTVTDPKFGQVTATANQPRFIQGNIRFDF